MIHSIEKTLTAPRWTQYRCTVCARGFRVLNGNKADFPEDCEGKPRPALIENGHRLIESGPVPLVPFRNVHTATSYRGVCAVKPWEYQVTVALPCIDHAEETALCVELLRRQTVKPFFVLVDTGSTPEELAKIEAMRSADLEVHRLVLNGYYHGSSSVGFALDLCFGRAETPYVFTTHQDCFVRRRDFLEHLIAEIKGHAVVGYRLTPRFHRDWDKMFGHTATLFDMEQWDALGATWALRRANRFGKAEPDENPLTPDGAWPDTESAMNLILLAAGAKTKFVGTEENYQRNKDQWIDHVRSLVGSSIWNKGYNDTAREWMADAMREARERLADWDGVPLTPPNIISSVTAEQVESRKARCRVCEEERTTQLPERRWPSTYCAIDLASRECAGCVNRAIGRWQARITGSPPPCDRWTE